MTSEEWQAEQKRVWGEGDAFRAATERLNWGENALIRMAMETSPDGAAGLVDAIVNVLSTVDMGIISPNETPTPVGVLERFEASRPVVTQRVRSALSDGVVPHGVVWIVANAFLRGDTSAVKEKRPPGIVAHRKSAGVTVFELTQ